MEVKLAKTAGFCFGVKRAVDTVRTQIQEGAVPIYTYGPIVHNETVVRELEQKGVRVLNTLEELQNLTEGTVIIRAHGVGRRIYELLKELPEDDRIIFLLYYGEGFNSREVAEILNLNENTVKSRLRRGRKKLEQAICY